jgi:hypothetical protein
MSKAFAYLKLHPLTPATLSRSFLSMNTDEVRCCAVKRDDVCQWKVNLSGNAETTVGTHFDQRCRGVRLKHETLRKQTG